MQGRTVGGSLSCIAPVGVPTVGRACAGLSSMRRAHACSMKNFRVFGLELELAEGRPPVSARGKPVPPAPRGKNGSEAILENPAGGVVALANPAGGVPGNWQSALRKDANGRPPCDGRRFIHAPGPSPLAVELHRFASEPRPCTLARTDMRFLPNAFTGDCLLSEANAGGAQFPDVSAAALKAASHKGMRRGG